METLKSSYSIVLSSSNETTYFGSLVRCNQITQRRLLIADCELNFSTNNTACEFSFTSPIDDLKTIMSDFNLDRLDELENAVLDAVKRSLYSRVFKLI